MFSATTFIGLRSVQPIPADVPFQQRLRICAELTETRLSQWLSAGETVPARLAEAMRYAALGGGKRLRPFLVMESARLCGVPDEAAVNAGAALECIHCYSLVHDDLPAMDDDDLRRGRPTVHRAFDEATAILAGDTLLTLAFEIMAHPVTHPDATVRAELGLGLARAAGGGGMAGGQMLDLEAAGRTLAEAEVLHLQALKTGALIRFGCEAGAILGRASGEIRQALHDYGSALGQAFQLADDLLDVEGDAALVGKTLAKDADAGKATLVGLIGVPRARARLADLEATARNALKPFGREGNILAEAASFVANRKH
jgi:farnesyl diphosphate synthase